MDTAAMVVMATENMVMVTENTAMEKKKKAGEVTSR